MFDYIYRRVQHHKSDFWVENSKFGRFHTVHKGAQREITTWAMGASGAVILRNTHLNVLILFEAHKLSPDTFMMYGKHLPETYIFSKKAQKALIPCSPRVCMGLKDYNPLFDFNSDFWATKSDPDAIKVCVETFWPTRQPSKILDP